MEETTTKLDYDGVYYTNYYNYPINQSMN
jgi:hypothetical protein